MSDEGKRQPAGTTAPMTAAKTAAMSRAESRVRQEVGRVAGLVPGPDLPVGRLSLTGDASFASCVDVDTAALAAASLANLAAGVSTVDRNRVAALFSCHVEVDGQARLGWADLSGYYRTATGGFIQFHCNFPHHAEGVVRHLGCRPDRESVQRAVLDHDPDELEAALVAAGMIAARMRTIDEWAAHPHATASTDLPLISAIPIGDGPPRDPRRRPRVLDCSRVLAGPVCGMTLAATGADVLRVGAARLPSVEQCVLATGFGKRNTDLDLTSADDRSTFAQLLAGADVWVDGYRPGALAGLGFPPDRAAPGSVVIQISAFGGGADPPGLVLPGSDGPWAGRRGFDSIVQTTTGLAAEGMARSGRGVPTPLPVQANDYCTGLLAAFAARRLVDHQAEVGGTWLARLSLLATRNWLVGLAPPVDFEPAPVRPDPAALHTVDTEWGRLTAARPIGGSWSGPPRPLGTSPPTWW